MKPHVLHDVLLHETMLTILLLAEKQRRIKFKQSYENNHYLTKALYSNVVDDGHRNYI
jgi:hypothetical protein